MRIGSFFTALAGGLVGASIVLLVGAAFSIEPIRSLARSVEPLAAWIQALGSVAAIIVAGRLVRLERLSHEVAAMASFQGAMWTADDVIQRLAAAADDQAANKSHTKSFDGARIGQARAILEHFSTAELGSQKAAARSLDMQALLVRAENALALERQVRAGTTKSPLADQIALESQGLMLEVDGWLGERRKRRDAWWRG